jgi:hypothetical protein
VDRIRLGSYFILNGFLFLKFLTNCLLVSHSLESAGDGGFMVSGLIQSDGDGERSRFVTWPRPSDKFVQ